MATIASLQAGNWSSASTWDGGVVPGDGDFVNISHAVVIDQDIGTVVGGGIKRIRIYGGSASLSFDAAAPRTVLFASTGTNHLGSGTIVNPGDDATMFGIYQSLGALNLTGTATNTLTLTSANDSSPIYIFNTRGMGDHAGGVTYNRVNITLKYCNIIHLGAASAWTLQGEIDGTTTFNVQNCYLDDVYYGVFVSAGIGALVVKNNTFGSTRFSKYIYTANTVVNSDISGNTFLPGSTVVNPAVDFLYAPRSLTAVDNALYATGNASSLINTSSNASAPHSPLELNNNVLYNTTHGGSCINYGSPATGTEIKGLVAFNVTEAAQCRKGGATVSGAFVRRSTTNGGDHTPMKALAGTHTFENNVIVHDSMAGTSAFFSWRGETGSSAPEITAHYIHNTAVNLGSAGVSKGFTFGNGVEADDQCTLSTCKSNLSVGFEYGFYDYPGPLDGSDPNDYVADATGAGVNHNATYGNTYGYHRNSGAAWGANKWDNGTTLHPNAIYGDIDGQNPNFVDTTRTIATYGASLGATGTDTQKIAYVFNELAKRHGIGGVTPSITISSLRSYLRAGFAPTNAALLNAGHDGVTIGAMEYVSADDTAPHLTDATATATSPTTATASVSTDDGNGTLYFLASTNATESASTVKAALSQSVTTAGEQSIRLSALNPETTYYVHFVQINGASLESTSVVSTSAITTPAIVYPEISATTSASSTSAVSATVTTDTAGGTIYGVLSESATVMEAAAIKSGADDSATVTGAGDYTLDETGLATWTQYYWHIVHEDADGLVSNILILPVKTLDISIPLAFSDTAPATLLTVQVWSKVPKKADVDGLY